MILAGGHLPEKTSGQVDELFPPIGHRITILAVGDIEVEELDPGFPGGPGKRLQVSIAEQGAGGHQFRRREISAAGQPDEQLVKEADARGHAVRGGVLQELAGETDRRQDPGEDFQARGQYAQGMQQFGTKKDRCPGPASRWE